MNDGKRIIDYAEEILCMVLFLGRKLVLDLFRAEEDEEYEGHGVSAPCSELQ